MKRLVFIVEGSTEERFVNELLRPYFESMGLFNHIQCYKLKHSKGGISKYSHIKEDIRTAINEQDAIVTTMFDFYRYPSDAPGSQGKDACLSHERQVVILEDAMLQDIENDQKRNVTNLIPYIQLHEFEALIFSSIEGMDRLFKKTEIKRNEILRVMNAFPNPEEINNGPNTAPSVRLAKLIPGYNKVTYGVDIIFSTGLNIVLERCPHFHGWVNKLLAALA